MNIRGQHFDNKSYQLSNQESIAIAKATQELLDTGEYTIYKPTINGAYEVQLTQLCEEMCDVMDFPTDDCVADRELGINEIVYLVCAGEGLL